MDTHDIVPEDIAATERLVGRPATTDAHRELLLRSLPKQRAELRALRNSTLAQEMSPALLFRPLLPQSPLSSSSSIILREETTAEWSGDIETLAFAPITQLAALLRSRRVSSRQLTELFLSRLKRFGPKLFCVVTYVPDEVALAAADTADRELASGMDRGMLHGIPYGAKDLFATVDLPTTDGVSPYKDRVLGIDAEVMQRLQAAGAILVAKLSMGELAMDDVWFGGRTRNPWSIEDGSSGSSAGSASAVAAGLVPFALGTETWGSIISPCNVCGTTGLRPTFGQIPRTGASALSWSMDKIGPIARSITDCALIFDTLRGPDGRDDTVVDSPFSCDFTNNDFTGMNVGYDVAAWEWLNSQEELRPLYEAVKATIERLVGKPLIPLLLPAMTPEYEAVSMTIIGAEGAASFAPLIASGGLDILVGQDEDNWPNIFRAAQIIPATEYIQAQRVRSYLMQEMQETMVDIDAYLTIPCVGPSLRYTNLTGHPEVITRCGYSESSGLPISLSLVGDLQQEEVILRLAHAYEQTTDWWRTPPGY